MVSSSPLNRLLRPQVGVIIGFWCAMAGFASSPALLSIGTLTMVAAGLLSIFQYGWFSRLKSDPWALSIGLIVLWVVTAGIWSKHFSLWWEHVRIQLPLLGLPVALAMAGPIHWRPFRIGLLVFLASVSLTGTATWIHYLSNKALIDQLIATSKPMPIWLGMSHIYFSYLQAIALFIGYWLWDSRSDRLFSGEDIVVGILLALNFLILHINTTRTGLGAFYLTLMGLGFTALIRKKKWAFALGLLATLVLIPVGSYFTMSSFRNRIDNTWMDISRYFQGKDPNYLSIGTRVESWKTAVHIWQKAPILGVGSSDLDQEMVEQYVVDRTKLCPENFEKPHNQFIEFLAGLGIIGFLLWAIPWFSPLFQRKSPRSWLFWAFWSISFLVMLFESVVQRQVGVTSIALFWMVFREPPRKPEL